MWVAALSNMIPTLVAAAVSELAAERVSSPRHAASTLPSISPLVGSWVNQRHRNCSLDYGKEFKHDDNFLAPTGALQLMMVYYISSKGHFLRFSLIPLVQLMLQVSL